MLITKNIRFLLGCVLSHFKFNMATKNTKKHKEHEVNLNLLCVLCASVVSFVAI